MAPELSTTTPPVVDPTNASAATAAATTMSSTTPIRGNTTTTNSSVKRSGTKKRPYRRTKRPKNYCDKSTVTTVTTPTRSAGDGNAAGGDGDPDGVNVYDAVLGECEDLLRASTEAQRLGRLKMASAYQLLLHTRLVGLGKRFDRSAMMDDQQKARQQQEEEQELSQQQQPGKQLDMEPTSSMDTPGTDKVDGAATPGVKTEHDTKAQGASDPGEDLEGTSPVPAAIQQLRSILPGNLEMDASMMEHLARAAVELHHQRTGRKKSADGLLASPLGGSLAAAAGIVPSASVATEPSSEEAPVAGSTATSTKPAASATKKSSVAWTKLETDILIKALKEGKDNYTIASTMLPNKTVAQVHSFVKNQQQLHKVNKLQEQVVATPDSAPSATTTNNTASDNGSAKPLAMNDTVDDLDAGKVSAAKGASAATAAPRRGGRGRKPPTTAMNTVPNVSMDVRALLRKANQKSIASTAPANTVEGDDAPASS